MYRRMWQILLLPKLTLSQGCLRLRVPQIAATRRAVTTWYFGSTHLNSLVDDTSVVFFYVDTEMERWKLTPSMNPGSGKLSILVRPKSARDSLQQALKAIGLGYHFVPDVITAGMAKQRLPESVIISYFCIINDSIAAASS